MHSLNTVEPELNLFFLQQLCFPSGCCNSRRAQRKIILSNLLIFWKRKLRPARSCDLPRLSQVVGKARRRNPVFGYHILLSCCYSRILQSYGSEGFCFPTLKPISETLDVDAHVLSRPLSFVFHTDFNIVDTQ